MSGCLFAALIFAALPTLAQRTCGTPLAITQAMTKYPKRYEMYRRSLQSVPSSTGLKSYARGQAVAVIPVVVHIVLTDPTSVTDAQVQSQINALNTDYDADNPDSIKIPEVWKSLFGDMQIQFCLAERTPDGHPTGGIDRVKTTHTSFSENDAASTVKHVSSGGADAWDPTQYLNIWVCNLRDNTLGIGTPPGLYPANEDGIVVQYNAFGTVGDLLPAFDKGRTCTHEIGHYFNLLHPWGDGDGSCSPGDGVDDTPPESAPAYDCPEFPDLQDPCSPDAPGIMFMNFMGYANDSCMEMFTLGQVARARDALLGPHASLLTSSGCEPVHLQNVDASVLNIHTPTGKICTGGITPSVTLKNMGKQVLSSVTVRYTVDGSSLHSYDWTGSLASLDTTVITLPAAIVDTGSHQLTIYSVDPDGTTDQQTQNDTVSGTFHLDPLATLPFAEGFEGNAFPPQGWVINNPDGSYTWEKTETAAFSGRYSVFMDNLDYGKNGPTDDLITPVFNLKGSDSAFLSFELAAAVQSNPQGTNAYWDTLEVLLSTDCGETGTILYKKWGANLITDSTATTQAFVPSASQWRRDSINLTPYLDKGNFQLIFRNVTNFENNIYLDNINLVTRPTNPILKEKKVLVVPNPTDGILDVQFLGIPGNLQQVAVYNSIGRLVARKQPSDINAQNRIEFNLAGEPNDVYFVKIFYTDHQVVKKIVKIK